MTNNVNLNSVSGAFIPYTPPKSAEEFVNGEVVKKAHEIFEKAIHSHLEECKLLRIPEDLFLKWKYLTNTNLISESDDFFSILRNEEVLPSLFSFLDRNSLQNLSQFSSLKEDVDQYVDRAFERYFGISCKNFQESINNYSFDLLNKMLNKAIKKDAPEIVFEKFLSILFPEDEISRIKFEEVLYFPLLEAIKSHAPTSTILSLLKAATRFGKICYENTPTNLLELTLKEKIATKEIIEALLNAGCTLDSAPDCTIFHALQYGASAEVIKTLIQAGAKIKEKGFGVTINDAIDNYASAEVVQLLLDKGAKVDVGRTRPYDNPSSIYRALQNGEASIEIIQILLNAGAKVTGMTVHFAGMMGVSREVYHLLEETRADKKRARRELESSYC